MARPAKGFFEGYTPKVARDLLGMVLVRMVNGERLSGAIVETEAYRGARDPASHAHRGKTKRNEVMFGRGGRAYVYFSYGSHWCLNVTTEPPGTAGAVLIRALEPKEGVEVMLRNRGLGSEEHLTDGPGKLTQALGIDSNLNGEDLVDSDRLFLEKGERVKEVGLSQRIGISKGVAFRWRFFAEGNVFVSKAKPAAQRRTHN